MIEYQMQVLIIDLTCVPYLDQTACKAFIEWIGFVQEKAHILMVAPEGQYDSLKSTSKRS